MTIKWIKKNKSLVIYVIILSIIIPYFLNYNFDNAYASEYYTKNQEYLYMGEYPQTEVSKEELTDDILNAAYDENGDATINGKKYRRIYEGDGMNRPSSYDGHYVFKTDGDSQGYHYYLYEPVKWNVLKKNDGIVYLMTDIIIDVNGYEQGWNENYKWNECTLYQWLNGNFIENIFNEEEKERLITQKIDEYDSKVWILSQSEVMNEEYGFSTYDKVSVNGCRYKILSDYASARTVIDDGSVKYGEWLLRSEDGYIGVVREQGMVFLTNSNDENICGICPVIVVKEKEVTLLSEEIKWTSDKNTDLYDRVYFGSYPQSEVLGDALTDDIINAEYDVNNDAIVGGEKYRRVDKENIITQGNSEYSPFVWSEGGDEKGYHYFIYEPIAWRILSDKDGKLYLLCDKVIDSVVYDYDQSKTDYHYYDSNVREWLISDDGFFGTAFCEEQAKVLLSGCEMTQETYEDKVWLLSYEEVTNTEYGFGTTDERTVRMKRLGQGTDYAWCRGLLINTYSQWWLRDVGMEEIEGAAAIVSWLGYVGEISSSKNSSTLYSTMAWDVECGARPAIYISKDEENLFKTYEEANEYNKQHYQLKDGKNADKKSNIEGKKKENRINNKSIKSKFTIDMTILIVYILAVVVIIAIIVIYARITHINYFLLVWKNIILFAKNRTSFFIMFIVGQIVSFMVLIFSYGVLEKSLVDKDVPDEVDLFIRATFEGEENENISMNIEEFKEKIYEVIEYLGDDFESTNVFGTYNGTERFATFIANEKYYEVEYVGVMSYEQAAGTECVARISRDKTDVDIGDVITAFGKEYRVIGKYNADIVQVPIETLDDNCKVGIFEINLETVPTRTRAKAIEKKIREVFGDYVAVSMTEGMDLLGVQKSKVMIICSVMIITLILINAGICYGYVLEKRNKWYSVMQLCGCDKEKGFLMYFSEILLLLSVCSMMGLLIFQGVIYPVMLHNDTLYKSIYTTGVYIRLLSAYIIFAIGVMSVTVFRTISKPILNNWRE